ncbi:MAG: hypothetical protein JNL66_05170 [Alphaproteobacteria bacterium]|nr:hypothetical protein [Alphaproteobacteria bacterium]
MTDHRYLGAADVDTLASLVMELAAQLHGERNRRLALEHVLASRGLVAAGEIEQAAAQPAVAEAARKSADESIRALLRIMTEGGDPKAPLRGEAVG